MSPTDEDSQDLVTDTELRGEMKLLRTDIIECVGAMEQRLTEKMVTKVEFNRLLDLFQLLEAEIHLTLNHYG